MTKRNLEPKDDPPNEFEKLLLHFACGDVTLVIFSFSFFKEQELYRNVHSR